MTEFILGCVAGMWLETIIYVLIVCISGAINCRKQDKAKKQKEEKDFKEAVLKELEELKKKDK